MTLQLCIFITDVEFVHELVLSNELNDRNEMSTHARGRKRKTLRLRCGAAAPMAGLRASGHKQHPFSCVLAIAVAARFCVQGVAGSASCTAPENPGCAGYAFLGVCCPSPMTGGNLDCCPTAAPTASPSAPTTPYTITPIYQSNGWAAAICITVSVASNIGTNMPVGDLIG